MRSVPWIARRGAAATAAVSLAACAGETPADLVPDDPSCAAFASEVQNGGPGKDGIPALSNPTLVSPSDPGTSYLRSDDRVIGVLAGGEAVAVPLNIGWWHEIVNLVVADETLAITHCPLTGSSIAFDRAPLDGAEFGVSGLLFRNNLIMYDRSAEESFWPQMSRAARCGALNGSELQMYPVVETSWASWVAAHPATRVVSSATGYARDYTQYPYGSYDQIDNTALLFPLSIDDRRPPKERVLAIPQGTEGIAYPFGELAKLGAVGAIDVRLDNEQSSGAALQDVVLLWDAAGPTAAAFYREVNGSALTFSATNDGIVDDQTRSVWGADGSARSGPLQGTTLEGVAAAYVAYWFAWVAFAPDTEIWTAP